MKVTIRDTRELKDGQMTCTLVIPTEAEDEFHMLKKQSREGRTLQLLCEPVPEKVTQYDDFMDFIREQFAKIERLGYEKGMMDATQGNLLSEEKGEQK